MTDVTVTSSSVVPTATTVIARGTAGSSIAGAGKAVYADPGDSYKIKPALATNATQANNLVGIALHAAEAGQPIAYATGGDVTFNSAFGTASVYVLSGANAGGIAPSADLESASTWYGVTLGMSTSATNLRLGITKSGAINP